MENYLIYLSESQAIQKDTANLIKCCEHHAAKVCNLYQSNNFVEGTGFMKTVKDEIDFVLAGYKRLGINHLDTNDFIAAWEFGKYIDYEISHLSGGWKKFLGLALFTNQLSEGKIYFDACRQLSDRLIEILFQNVSKSNSNTTYFFEYDTSILTNFDCSILYYSNGIFEEKQGTKLNNVENNYE